MSLEYRREIDGLRAVAVLPVILFHAGVKEFGGGYVGVDVFFVLSGYLITSIIQQDLERERFSIANFYERRVRRIIPAMFFVILCTTPLAWLLMTPDQFAEYGASVASVVAFCSNIFFWLKSNYFSGSAELKPMLHTWSLAVEEQYYLLFPLVLALAWKRAPKLITPSIALIAIASFALATWASHNAEGANFFLTPTRAWELLAGALCARLHWQGQVRASLLKEMLAAGGLALILIAILAFDDRMRFPGPWALVPVLGTVLAVLFATVETKVGRLLSWRPLVGIGLISYSAYLWHQPLFALARLQSQTAPSFFVMLLLALLALVMAAFSWRFVEQPFRDRTSGVLRARKQLFIATGAAGAFLFACGLTISALKPPTLFSLQHPGLFETYSKRAYEPQGEYEGCPGLPSSAVAECRSLGQGPDRVIIWGDSHANALSAAARPLAGHQLFVLGQWGCPPAWGVFRYDGFGNAANCDRAGEIDRYGDYVLELQPRLVILVARWTLYTQGNHEQDRLQRETYFLTDNTGVRGGASESQAVLTRALVRTVERLRRAGIQVAIVQQAPDLHDLSPRGLLVRTDIPRAGIDRWHVSESRLLEAARSAGATIVPTHDLFCGMATCRLRDRDVPLYIDSNHLNYDGARPVFDRLVSDVIDAPRSNDAVAQPRIEPGQ